MRTTKASPVPSDLLREAPGTPQERPIHDMQSQAHWADLLQEKEISDCPRQGDTHHIQTNVLEGYIQLEPTYHSTCMLWVKGRLHAGQDAPEHQWHMPTSAIC